MCLSIWDSFKVDLMPYIFSHIVLIHLKFYSHNDHVIYLYINTKIWICGIFFSCKIWRETSTTVCVKIYTKCPIYDMIFFTKYFLWNLTDITAALSVLSRCYITSVKITMIKGRWSRDKLRDHLIFIMEYLYLNNGLLLQGGQCFVLSLCVMCVDIDSCWAMMILIVTLECNGH